MCRPQEPSKRGKLRLNPAPVLVQPALPARCPSWQATLPRAAAVMHARVGYTRCLVPPPPLSLLLTAARPC